MDEDDLLDYTNRGVGRAIHVVDQVVEVCTENENYGEQVNNDEHDNDEHDNDEHDNNEYEST